MGRDNDREIIQLPGLDGSATVVADVVKYLVMPDRPSYLRSLVSLANGAITFTNETGRVLVDYATTIGGSYTSVHTETAANANTWTNGTPKVHTVATGSSAVRIPANAILRVTFDVAGTSPSFAGFGVYLGLQFV